MSSNHESIHSVTSGPFSLVLKIMSPSDFNFAISLVLFSVPDSSTCCLPPPPLPTSSLCSLSPSLLSSFHQSPILPSFLPLHLTVLAAVAGAIPFIGPYWVAMPAVLEVWLVDGSPVAAIAILTLSLLPAFFVDSIINSEIEG